MMPVASPGRTCLVLCPSHLGSTVSPQAWREAISAITQSQQMLGTRVIQVLLADEPASAPVAEIFAQAGYGDLAKLRYLQRRVDDLPARWPLPRGLRLLPFSNATRPLFEQAIRASYVDSLDCPALHEVRPINEVIESHKAAGAFRPDWWQVLVRDGSGSRREGGGVIPVGVLLLAGMGEKTGGLELVYLGLAPEARGKGLARYLLNVASRATFECHEQILTLAVDDANKRAIALYESCGFRLLRRRRVLARDLVRNCPLGSPIHVVDPA